MNLTLVQADILRMPFPRNMYDYVLCLGVLQHTPSPEASIGRLWEMVKPGGVLVVDHYRNKWSKILPPPLGGASWLYRKIILCIPQARRFNAVKKVVDFWFPYHWKYRNSKCAQRILSRLSPVHFYFGSLPLRTRQDFYEWALLDTHDGTTDVYKHHRSARRVRKILQRLGAVSILVREAGNGVEASCSKPKELRKS